MASKQEQKYALTMDEANIFHEPPSRWRDFLIRLCRNKLAIVGLLIILAIAFVAIFADQFAPYDPYVTDMKRIAEKPSAEHLLGCDELGRDILSRLIYGARVSLTVGFIATLISTTLSTSIGLVSAYYGKTTDLVIMRIMDMFMAFPSILLAIIFMSVFGRGIENAVLAMSIVSVPGGVRMTRSMVLAVKETDYVQAAKAIGCKDISIMFKHILPNVAAPIILGAAMGISGAILTTSALGFLGLGVMPPTAEWGYMLSTGRSYIFNAPHLIAFPGIAIGTTLLTFNLFGDGLRDALDPRLK